jgi:GNAT superfamily N-acetyltransferase
MGDVTIRAARAEDAEAFVRSYELSWNAGLAEIAGRTLGELSPFEDRIAAFTSGVEHPPPGVMTFVAEVDGTIVGIAVVVPESSKSGELRALYVVPAVWGSGVASLLLERALEFMRSQRHDDACCGSLPKTHEHGASTSARVGTATARRG